MSHAAFKTPVPHIHPLYGPRAGFAESATRGERFANLDRLRLLALIEVVTFHATGEHILLGAGLPIFMILTVALNARPTQSAIAPFARRKLRSFLVPWATWSAMYALSYIAAALVHGHGLWGWFEPIMLIVGTQRHLWYLIFAFVGSLLAFVVRRRTSGVHPAMIVVLGSMLGCGVMLLEREFGGSPSRASEWLLALPAIPIGISLGRCLFIENSQARAWLTLLLFCCSVAGMMVLEYADSDFSAERYVYALGPVCVCAIYRGKADRLTGYFTRLRLGIYLIHPLIVSAIHLAHEDTANPVLRATASAIGATAITAIVMKTPLRRLVTNDRPPS